jgi:hypothetical protein
MSTLRLSTAQWKAIRYEIQQETPKSVFMLRDKMKRVLGFTIREHSEWLNGDLQYSICLDFYSERKYTMFLIKYSEYINKKV